MWLETAQAKTVVQCGRSHAHGENMFLEVDTRLSSRRVTRSLESVIERRGKPEAIRWDNGPELTLK